MIKIFATEIFTQFPSNAQFNVQGVDIPFKKFSKPVLCVKNDHLIDNTLSDEKVKKWQSDHGQVVPTFRLNT